MSYIDLTDGTKLVSKITTAEVGEREGRIIALVSTDCVDSDNDIIHQGPNEKGAGWILDKYNENPIMTWSHDLNRPNIGNGTAVLDHHEKHGLSLFLLPEFDMEDPFAASIEGKIRRGFLRQTSVGYRGLKAEPRASEKWGIEFFEQRLQEIGWCNLGANDNTEVHIKSMLGRDAALAGMVEGRDSAGVEIAKAELAGVREEYADRLATLERIVSDFGDMRERMDEEKLKHEVRAKELISGMVRNLSEAGLIKS